MSQTLATPGVYIEEKSAFPNSVAGIPTAVPAFVGYTEKTSKDGKSLVKRPVRISSMADFIATFGAGSPTTFSVQPATGALEDFKVNGKGYTLNQDSESRFILYDAIRLFYSNGGGPCWIVSAGGYYKEAAAGAPAPASTPSKDGKKDDKGAAPSAASSKGPQLNTISKSNLSAGLGVLIEEDEPTLVVIPEAVMLEEADCFALQQEMLQHCGYKMQNRFAILDVFNGSKPRSYDKDDVINRFREGIGTNYLNYGACYYPNLLSSVVQADEISFKNVSNIDVLEKVLTEEADEVYDAKKSGEVKAEIKKLSQAGVNEDNLNQTLNVISPTFKRVQAILREKVNLLPPSAAMAGIYTAIDNSRGVWKAPANTSVASIITPAVKITHDDQEDLNVTVTGKSVNAIRPFVGEGTLVWGARTLDGNSQDWRYINVRRTMIFIEQSIKLAAKPYVYEANTAGTWVLVKSMISSFLNNVWKQGGLAGATPADAYEVQVGLGATMTANDILDGVMKITVKVAITRPAEFIVITFQQKMQES